MSEEIFWAIIERTRKAGSYQAQLGELENELLKLPVSEIEKFDNRFTSLMANSYTYKLWGAAYVINGGCSDDCFDYFRQYLISHGKARFYQALSDPESMAPWIKSEEQEEWEGLGYAAGNAYLIKANKPIPKSYAPQYKIVGKPFKEEDLPREYPKLAKKFMQ